MPFRRTTVITAICLSAIGGLILGRIGWTVEPLIFIIIPFLLFRRVAAYSLIVLALGLGVWRGQAHVVDSAVLGQLVGRTVAITATVADDPSAGAKGGTTFTLTHLVIDGRPVSGNLPVYTYSARVRRGFTVSTTAKLRPGYGKYAASLSYPTLTTVSAQQSELEQVRGRFFAGMRTALTEPASSFGLGLLVGIRGLLPKDLQDLLTLVGLSHLVAVSGYNLTIIVQAVDRIFLRFGRGIALVTSLWLIATFLAVTGASPPVVRAAIVSVLVLLGAFYGRDFNRFTLLSLVAAGTAIFNPAYLTDFSWLLSFLAFYGILILAPAWYARFGEPRWLAGRLLVETTAAQVLTLPLILFSFGQLSIVAPLTNIIILPLIPLAMATSFVAGLAGMFIPAFCGWLAWPAQVLIDFILTLVAGFAALPWAGITVHWDLATMLLAYCCVGLITLALYHAPVKRQADKLNHLAKEGIGTI